MSSADISYSTLGRCSATFHHLACQMCMETGDQFEFNWGTGPTTDCDVAVPSPNSLGSRMKLGHDHIT